jgi:predicted choloylglycine hydrolase
MEIQFSAVEEATVGAKWQALFQRYWPSYRKWYLLEGIEARPTFARCERQLKQHMPELLPTYERICEAAGGGDLPARFLSLYKPPAYLTGCSQVVWPGEEPMLIRNYDYAPALCEGMVMLTRWNGRAVLAMVDCLWGALDGVNDAGLAVSLTFGGRKVVGDGFGVPLIVRYILEFCDTTDQAAEVLRRVPCHMAYNVTVVDKTGAFVTAFIAPDREPYITPIPIAANHQGRIDWHRFARATSTLERERFLFFRLQDSSMTTANMVNCFLRSPLYTTAYNNGFGTLYTAVYTPASGVAQYIWPDGCWRKSLSAFEEEGRRQRYLPTTSLAGHHS